MLQNLTQGQHKKPERRCSYINDRARRCEFRTFITFQKIQYAQFQQALHKGKCNEHDSQPLQTVQRAVIKDVACPESSNGPMQYGETYTVEDEGRRDQNCVNSLSKRGKTGRESHVGKAGQVSS